MSVDPAVRRIILRRGGDSNPGNPLGVYSLSRRASSTTPAPLLSVRKGNNYFQILPKIAVFPSGGKRPVPGRVQRGGLPAAGRTSTRLSHSAGFRWPPSAGISSWKMKTGLSKLVRQSLATHYRKQIALLTIVLRFFRVLVMAFGIVAARSAP